MTGQCIQNCLIKANDFRKEYEDQLISVEHLVLALADTNGITKKVFQGAGCSPSKLKEVVLGLRKKTR